MEGKLAQEDIYTKVALYQYSIRSDKEKHCDFLQCLISRFLGWMIFRSFEWLLYFLRILSARKFSDKTSSVVSLRNEFYLIMQNLFQASSYFLITVSVWNEFLAILFMHFCLPYLSFMVSKMGFTWIRLAKCVHPMKLLGPL